MATTRRTQAGNSHAAQGGKNALKGNVHRVARPRTGPAPSCNHTTEIQQTVCRSAQQHNFSRARGGPQQGRFPRTFQLACGTPARIRQRSAQRPPSRTLSPCLPSHRRRRGARASHETRRRRTGTTQRAVVCPAHRARAVRLQRDSASKLALECWMAQRRHHPSARSPRPQSSFTRGRTVQIPRTGLRKGSLAKRRRPARHSSPVT
jgi:hypothetical protein